MNTTTSSECDQKFDKCEKCIVLKSGSTISSISASTMTNKDQRKNRDSQAESSGEDAESMDKSSGTESLEKSSGTDDDDDSKVEDQVHAPVIASRIRHQNSLPRTLGDVSLRNRRLVRRASLWESRCAQTLDEAQFLALASV